jgi:hypothetical protein
MDGEDVVLQLLVSLHLTEREQEFRGILENIADDPTKPRLRDLVITTVGVLMSMGGIAWPVTLTMLNHMRRRPDAQLAEDSVAIVNGAALLLPQGEDQVRVIDLLTMRDTDEDIPAFVSNIYSFGAVWKRTVEILSS